MHTTLSLAVGSLSLAGSLLAVQTEPLFDGTGVEAWDTARDQARLTQEFALSEVRSDGQPPALLWRFVSRGIAFNDLFLRRPLAEPFDVIRAHVRNEGAALRLSAKVGDASRAEWTAREVPLAAGADWQWVEFPWADWQVASWSHDADGRLDFPLSYFTLIAFGVTAGPEYRLRVDRVEAVRPDPPVARLREFTLPAELRTGEECRVSLAFDIDKPCRQADAALLFRRDGTVTCRVPLTGSSDLTQVTPGARVAWRDLPVRLPRFATGGRLGVALRLGEARVLHGPQATDDGPEVATVTVQGRTPGRTVAEVRAHHGAPTLFINGQPHSGMAWATYHPTAEVFRDFTRAGVNLYTFSATPTEAGYGLSQTTWTAPDRYDYSEFDQRALMLLEENPEAYFFPRLYLHAPAWWSAAHPDEVVQMDPGDGKPVPFLHSGNKPAPCWASEVWRRDTVEGLRRFIAHVEQSPFADRVVGYHLASGTTEEWMMWGANENEWVDYSPANTRAFGAWLRRRYTSDEALRTAWADPAASLETATVPPKTRRAGGGPATFRDPAADQAVIDFYQYNSDMVADTIGHLAGAVKEITHRERIVGVFYGYLLQLCGEQRQQNAGHLALARVLASPDVDFLTSPTSYAFRQLGGEGTCHFMSLYGSVRLHGKLWFNENDVRTSLAGGKVGEWGRPADLAGDLIQQDKELAHAFCQGAAQWWFDVGSNRYEHPDLMRRIAELTRTGSRVLDLDRSPADQAAFVVDETSLTFMRVGDPLGSALLLGQLPALHRLGAPVGHYLSEDLPQLADRRLLIFPTSTAPTAADRQAIDRLKDNGRVLVFLFAPGLFRDGHTDDAAAAELTGLRLQVSREPAALRVRLAAGHPLTEGLDGVTYGTGNRGLPVVTADDPQARVLGTLEDGRPGLVVRDFGTWTAVFSTAPLLPAALWRRLARLAGVHEYVDSEDVVWASRQMVGVCVKDGGPRTVRLPRPATVRDLYSGERLATEPAASFRAEFAPRQTRVFVLE